MARPRSFDTQDALRAATQVFLLHGFDGATLDDLTQAMGINKPSLYAAFGDKSALYAGVLGEYAAMAKSAMEAALDEGDTLEDAARSLLLGAIDVYAPAKGEHLGCLIATTATTAAGADPTVRRVLSSFLAEMDGLIAAAIARRFRGELADGPLASVAEMLSATIFSLAIRARAGESRKRLLAIAHRAVSAIRAIARA